MKFAFDKNVIIFDETNNKIKMKTQTEIKMKSNLKNLTEEQLTIAFNLLFKVRECMVWDSDENLYCMNENFVVEQWGCQL